MYLCGGVQARDLTVNTTDHMLWGEYITQVKNTCTIYTSGPINYGRIIVEDNLTTRAYEIINRGKMLTKQQCTIYANQITNHGAIASKQYVHFQEY